MPKVRGEGVFVKLYVEWVDNEKLSRAGMACRGVHTTAMCLAKRSDRDGWFPRYTLVKEGAGDDLIDECIEREILDVEGAYVRPWDWLDRNLSQDAISATKSKAGSLGNHNRWDHPGPFGECPICHPVAPPPPNLPFDRTASQGDRTDRTDRKVSPESESDTDNPPQSSGLLQEAEIHGVMIEDVFEAIVDIRAAVNADRIRSPNTWRPATLANLRDDRSAHRKILAAIETYDESARLIAEIVEGRRTNTLGLKRRAS